MVLMSRGYAPVNQWHRSAFVLYYTSLHGHHKQLLGHCDAENAS